MNNNSILFIERIVTNYRVPFFLGLHQALQKKNICLTVLGGKSLHQEHLIDSLHELPFGQRINNRYILRRIYLQKGLINHIKRSKLVILGQENRAISTHFLLLKRQFGQNFPHIAFYDHGPYIEKKSITSSLNYAFKKSLSLRADWWFAYTELSKSRLLNCGYDSSRITVVNNAIDTQQILAVMQKGDSPFLTTLYNELFDDNINQLENIIIGVYCSRLVVEKKVDFLLFALEHIIAEIPNFKMLIIGDGPYKQQVQNFCSTRPWCKYLGSLYGNERIPYFALADIWLNPGTVGLTILDAFASSAPIFTTASSICMPEICYLENNINGVIAEDDVNRFAHSVIKVIQDQDALIEMQAAAGHSALKYSLEAMIENFCSGIIHALQRI